MIDFIGDIHGHRERLEALLKKLGYAEVNGAYRHPTNTAIFLGDYIDRGPDVRGTVNLVRNMVEAGSAKALLGNHEFNALCFWLKNPEGGFLRDHSINKILIHVKTMESYRDHVDEFLSARKWFLSLPIFLEEPLFRAQHACFNPESIAVLRKENLETLGSFENVYRICANKELKKFFDDVIQGPEEELGNGLCFYDSEGVRRTRARTKWWIDPKDKTLRDMSFQTGAKIPELPLSEETLSHPFYGESERPVFFGHYWLEGLPRLFRSNVCCLDYSVASYKGNGTLAAYRFDGEQILNSENFVYV